VIVRPTGGYRFPEHVRVTVGTVEENKKFIGALERIISTR
jgi:histidinol-phosphate aminotransferase